MSLIVKPFTFTVGAVIVASQHNSNFDTIYSDYNGNITTANIASSAAIADTQLAQITTAGKLSGAAFTSLTSIPAGAGVIPTANLGTGIANSGTTLLGNGTWGNNPYIKLSNTQNQNVAGGATSSGAWRDILLNTRDIDTASISTFPVNTNEITLPAGIYKVWGQCPLYLSGACQTRLYNITDAAAISGLLGSSLLSNVSTMVSSSIVQGMFTISSSKTIAFQYQTSGSEATDGQGKPSNLGQEVYATIEFTKVG